MAAAGDAWDPERYERFRAEREQPALDLIDLVDPVPGGRVADLGCGTGRITARLHAHSQAAETVGLDSSPQMLGQANRRSRPGLRFEAGDISDLGDHSPHFYAFPRILCAGRLPGGGSGDR